MPTLSLSKLSRSKRSSVGEIVVTLSVLLGGALGCSGDTPTSPPAPDAAAGYWTLQLPYHAVNLALTAPYDTVRLFVVARNVQGEPFASSGTVTYRTTGTAVTVDSTGLVRARVTTASTQVIATLQDPQQLVTRADTVTIKVTATAPPLPFQTFSLQPLPGDSAKRAVDFLGAGQSTFGQFLWPVQAVNGVGATVCNATACGLLVYHTSSNPAVATVDPFTGVVTTKDSGHVVFTASTLAYGQVLSDSVDFRMGYPIHPAITLLMIFMAGALAAVGFTSRKVMVVGLGSVVLWSSCNLHNNVTSGNTQNFDVIFDQPAAADTASCNAVFYNPGYSAVAPPTGSGDIAPFGGDTTGDPRLGGGTNTSENNFRCRRFSVPGVYHWHSSLFPSDTFTLIVKQE
jgi:hypothetical protein